jgi:hypothetical protein
MMPTTGVRAPRGRRARRRPPWERQPMHAAPAAVTHECPTRVRNPMHGPHARRPHAAGSP